MSEILLAIAIVPWIILIWGVNRLRDPLAVYWHGIEPKTRRFEVLTL